MNRLFSILFLSLLQFTLAVAAPFSLKVDITPQKAGMVDLYPNPTTVESGQQVSLSVSARRDYVFTGWYEGDKLVSNSNELTYTMPARDVTLNAVFRYDPKVPANPDTLALYHRLHLESKPHHLMQPKDMKVQQGKSIGIQSNEQKDYTFERWEDETGVTVSSTPSFTYKMPGQDKNLYAIFQYNPETPEHIHTNEWNAVTKELTMDNFKPGELVLKTKEVLKKKGLTTEDVQRLTVQGTLTNEDLEIGYKLYNCLHFDFSRTNGASRIPSQAFLFSKMRTLHVPESITYIEEDALYGCENLEVLYFYCITAPFFEASPAYSLPRNVKIYVPEAALDSYLNSELWDKFNILPLGETLKELTIKFPPEIYPRSFYDLWMELINVKTGQKKHYVMSGRDSYVFPCIKNTCYDLVIRNEKGDIFGRHKNIEVKEENVTVTLKDVNNPQDVRLNIISEQHEDLTDLCNITWTDESGAYMGYGNGMYRCAVGKKLHYTISLPEKLATKYVTPTVQSLTVSKDMDEIVYTLQPFQQVILQGQVVGKENNKGLPDVLVSSSQTISGKYHQNQNTGTDAEGKFSMTVSDVPTKLTFTSNNHISQSLNFEKFDVVNGVVQVPQIKLEELKGATINLKLAYQYSHLDGETQETMSGYEDTDNVRYSLYNKTQNFAIELFKVRYPQIVLLDKVQPGDVIELTAESTNGGFKTVKTTLTLDEKQNGEASLTIQEWGRIEVSFGKTTNAAVIGALYDSRGHLCQTKTYKEAKLDMKQLPDGDYTLISVGESELFNSIYDLNQWSLMGLTEGTDYVKNNIHLSSGLISKLHIAEIPAFDRNQQCYTEGNTSFDVNKTEVTIGNYVTFKGNLQFKSQYEDRIKNLKLIVDIPEGCAMVENSVMVGQHTAEYTEHGNAVTIPLQNSLNTFKLCVIPEQGNEYTPNAYVDFQIDGKQIRQPIGTAYFKAENIKIQVPAIFSSPKLNVSGIAQAQAEVTIYDGQTVIGRTQAAGDGGWMAACNIPNLYNLSRHRISARIQTAENKELQSEVKECVYNQDAIEVSKVTMLNFADNGQQTTVFDFLNPASAINAYRYFPSYPTFTFLIDFTKNDTSLISDVVLHVHTSQGHRVPLKATYEEKEQKWVASADFGNWNNYDIPGNVSVDFNTSVESRFDQRYLDECADIRKKEVEKYDQEKKEFDEIWAVIEQCMGEEKIEFEALKAQMDILYGTANIETATEEDFDVNQFESWEEWDAYMKENYDDFLNEGIPEEMPGYEQMLKQDHMTLEQDGQQYEMSVKDCTGLNEAEMEQNGYTKIETTDGAFMYIKSEGHIRYIADLKNNQYYTISSTGLNPVDLQTLNQNWPTLSEKNEKFFDFINNITGLLGNLKDELDAKIITQTKKLNQANQLRVKTAIRFRHSNWNDPNDWLHKKWDLKRAIKGVWLEKAALANLKTYQGIKGFANSLANKLAIISIAYNGYKMCVDLNEWNSVIAQINAPCKEAVETAQDLMLKAQENQKRAMKGYAWTLGADVVSISMLLPCVTAAVVSGGSAWPLVLVNAGTIATSLAAEAFLLQKSQNEKNYIKSQIPSLKEKCKEKEEEEEEEEPKEEPEKEKPEKELHPSNNPFVPAIHDPAGFVYEAVPSNRLEGVTATCFYKEFVEDMYGDIHEKVVKWDAERYAQKNPLFTDKEGMYRWDVPQGLWQVKFEKEGYETTHSEWLPVPPPQLEVNIGMKQNRQPEVKMAKAYDDAVVIEFSKYMYLDELNTRNIQVLQNGKKVEGKVVWLNAEETYQNGNIKFASKVRFNAATPFTEKEVTLIVKNRVRSYADIRMQDNFTQTFSITPEIKDIVCNEKVEMGYSQPYTLTISALPVVAAAGKTLHIKNSSERILGINTQSIVLNNEGKAQITLEGKLPGSAGLTLSIDNCELKKDINVNVNKMQMKNVATPTASIASGATVNKGTELTLACKTTGATIYYTLDGSCPCDETTSVMEYDGTPIVINEDVTVKAMARAPKMYDSEVATFTYKVMKSVATPEASIASGAIVEKGTEVTLTCETEGAAIYYTLDGTSPAEASTSVKLYDGTPIVINEDMTLKVMARAENMYDSEVVTYTYTLMKTVATPTASIASGAIVEKGTEVTLTCETEGAAIYYTLDGTSPAETSTSVMEYDGTPIVINEDMTLKVMARAENMYDSEVVTYTYTLMRTVETPKSSIASGAIVEKGTEVTLTCETEGAAIYYTLDGTSPAEASTAVKQYDGTPIVINEDMTLKVVARAENMYDSEVVTYTYTLMRTVATPTASIASGSEVDKGMKLYLYTETEGAKIFYTLDGSDPSEVSDAVKLYDETPIVIHENITIKAIARAENMHDSEVATFIYTVHTESGLSDEETAQYAVYPTAVKNTIHIDIPDNQTVQLSIVNTGGKVVYKEEQVMGQNTIDLSDLSAGTYLVILQNRQHQVITKIIKVNP